MKNSRKTKGHYKQNSMGFDNGFDRHMPTIIREIKDSVGILPKETENYS